MNEERYTNPPPRAREEDQPIEPIQVHDTPPTPQDEFEPFEVDTETGEIIEPANGITIEHLPRVGMSINQIAIDADHLMNPRLPGDCLCKFCYLGRIKAHYDKAVEGFSNRRTFWIEKARGLVEATGQRSLDYPGIGRFGLRKGSPHVDRTKYDSLPAEDQEALYAEAVAECRDSFTAKTTVKPDMAKIKADLKAGNDVPGFSLKTNADTFSFKSEL